MPYAWSEFSMHIARVDTVLNTVTYDLQGFIREQGFDMIRLIRLIRQGKIEAGKMCTVPTGPSFSHSPSPSCLEWQNVGFDESVYSVMLA